MQILKKKNLNLIFTFLRQHISFSFSKKYNFYKERMDFDLFFLIFAYIAYFEIETKITKNLKI